MNFLVIRGSLLSIHKSFLPNPNFFRAPILEFRSLLRAPILKFLATFHGA